MATENAPAPVNPGSSTYPGTALATRATISGTGVADADSARVFIPELTGAAFALEQANVNTTSIGRIVVVGVIEKTKV